MTNKTIIDLYKKMKEALANNDIQTARALQNILNSNYGKFYEKIYK